MLEARHPPAAPREQGLSFARLIQYLVAGIIAFCSIAGGTYLGFSAAARNVSTSQLLQSRNHSYLDIGDTLPDYALVNRDSHEHLPARQAISGKCTVLLFLSRSCGACETMLDFWKEKVIPHLRSDIAVLAVYDEAEWAGSNRGEGSEVLTLGIPVMTTRRADYEDVDGIQVTPSLIAVDRQGRIALISTGFSRMITSELLNKLLR